MATSRSIIKQIHLWLGLASGLVVFVVCTTGALLAFEEELDALFNPRFYVVDGMGDHVRPMDSLATRVLGAFPEGTIQRIDAYAAPGRTVQFRVVQAPDATEYLVSVNPYSGRIQASVPVASRFFEKVLGLHRYLLMGTVGKAITGASCLIFIVLLTSGLFLWWPKKRKHLKKRLAIKWKAPWARRLWDLHAVPGFYMLLVLLVLALSGLVWSYKWYDNLVHHLANGGHRPNMEVLEKGAEKRMPATGNSFSLAGILEETAHTFPFQGDVRILFPAREGGVFRVRKLPTEAKVPNKRSTIFFDGRTGYPLKVVPYEELTNGEKVRRMLFPIHTGAIGGWPTRILALLACLIGASLPITGFLFWWRQRR